MDGCLKEKRLELQMMEKRTEWHMMFQFQSTILSTTDIDTLELFPQRLRSMPTMLLILRLCGADFGLKTTQTGAKTQSDSV